MLLPPGVHGPHHQATTQLLQQLEWQPKVWFMLCSLDSVGEAEQEATTSPHLRE